MKRCAILLSGLYRNVNNMENIIEHIMKPNPIYQFDIIFSVWDITFKDCIADTNANINEDKFITTDVNELINIYNPVKYSIMNYKEFDRQLQNSDIIQKFVKNNNTFNYRAIERSIFQFYTCENVINTLEEYEIQNNMKYDTIIRYRFDLFTNNPIILNNYNLNNVHGINRLPYIPDWLYIGNNTNMKQLMKIYRKIENYEIKCDSPENIFFKNMDNSILFDIPDSFVLNKHGHYQY